MIEHPLDICECGDYRKDHPDNGACKLNGLGHGIPGGYKCEEFRLASQNTDDGDTRGLVLADDPEY